jgi:hypothetical protein
MSHFTFRNRLKNPLRAGGRSHAFLRLRVVLPLVGEKNDRFRPTGGPHKINLPIQPREQHEVPPARRQGAFASGSVAALIHAGDAVVPAEAVVVEARPKEA